MKPRAVLGVALLGLAACGEVGAAPPRGSDRPSIVSLNPCADAILAEVAAPEQLLAISHYSKDPSSTSMSIAEAEHFAHTGGTVEEILALEPDVVVASAFLAPATHAALSDLGIRIHTLGMGNSVEQSLAQVRDLARLTGNIEKGERLAARIAQAAASDPDSAEIKALVWQQGGIVPGEATLIHELLAMSGFASQTEQRGLSQASHVSLEAMLADPPEVIFIAGSGPAQDHPALQSFADTAVIALPARMLFCGGPSVIEASEYLRKVRASLTESGAT